jgi:hypothetical protein
VAANEVPAENPEMAADQQPIEQFEPAGVEPLPEKPLDVDPMPPPDAPEELPPKKPAAKEVAIVDEPVPVERPAQAPIKTKPAPPSVAAPAAEPPEPAENIAAPTVEAPPAQYTSTDGVLLRFDARDAGWYVMPRRSLIHPGEKLAVPEPYEAVIQFGTDRSLLKLLPATVIERLGPTAAAPFGIAVERGRVHFLSGTAPEGQPFAGTTVAVAVRGELWRVELLTPRSVCGVEIVPREPSALDENFGKNSYTGGLYVAQGSVRFADGADRVLVLEGPAWVPLNPELRAAEGGAMVAPLSSIPDWLSDKKAPLTVNNYGKLFEKEFDFDEPVDVSLTNAVKDRKPEISRLAVACLGLTGDHAGMLQALDRSEHEESRLAAIHGLRTWLVLDPQHAVTLKSDLNRHFHPDEAEAAYRLLWGFNEADARDPDASNELVTWLSSESLAIRELAFFNVQRLTGRRYDYRPNGIPAHRKSAVNQWLRHLEKDGALLPPNGKAPSADRGAFSTLRSTSRS